MLDRQFFQDLTLALLTWSTAWEVLQLALVLLVGVWAFPWSSATAIALLVLSAAAYYYFVCAAPTLIYSSNSAGEQRILRRMPCIRGRGFYPTPYLINSHVQTLFAAMGRPLPLVNFQRQLNFDVFPDGEVCVVDWAFADEESLMRWQASNARCGRATAQPLSAMAADDAASGLPVRHFRDAAEYNQYLEIRRSTTARAPCPFAGPGPHTTDALRAHQEDMATRMTSGLPPVVIIFHGLTGGNEDNNVYHIAKWALRKGWHAVVPVRRGCADRSELLTRDRHYAYGGLGDTAHVVNHIADSMPGYPILAVGLSAGSNVMANYMAVHGRASRIYGAVSVANGYCWERGTAAIRDDHPVWDVIMTGLVASTLYHRHKDKISLSSAEAVASPSSRRPASMREYDELVSRTIHGFDSLSEFYVEQSCIHRLHKVKHPIVFLNALDDPLAAGSVIPYDALLRNPNTILVCTPRGGHLGWATGWWPFRSTPTFMDAFVIEALDALLREANLRAAAPEPVSAATAAPRVPTDDE